MNVRFKLISATSFELFEERLNTFIQSLSHDDVIVDVKFSTAPSGDSVAYSALVHYQVTEAWAEG